MSSMGQIVKQKKKGRPSKADLARRAADAEIERRRSLRRRNVKYNIDYDDYLDDEEEFVEEEEEDEEEEEVRRREKKLRLLNQMPESVGSRGRTAARGEHARTVSEDDKPDCDEDDDERVNEEKEKEETGRKVDSKGCESLPGTPCGLPSGIPLPEKKKLELILDKLQKKDIYGVYAEPVDPEELPDYHDVIEHPMDFTTVRKKLGNGSYATLEQFESDIFLICSNAMQYNSADTIYHKQARSIEELARKKFHKLRIEFERSEKEMKAEQKLGSNSFVRKQIRKPVCRTSQEPIVGSDFTSGAALATTAADLQNSFIATQSGACERPGNADRLVENNSPLDHTYPEKTEDLSSGKGLSKLGKKSFLLDENPRATYNIANEVRSESVLATFEGEVKQLVAVGLHAEYSYARSLARFAATIGPVAWKVASQRIEKALPDGCKFGRGWVGEYEPLPTPVLVAENRIQNECTRLHSSAGLRKDSDTFKTSLSPRPTPTPDRKPNLFAPTTPNISTRHQQNPPPKHLLDPQNKVSRQVEMNSPSSVNRNNIELVSGRQLPNGSEITTSRGLETMTRNMNASRPAPFKQPNSNGVATRGLPNGKVTNTGLSPRIGSPSPDTIPNQMGRTATYFPRGNEQGLTDPVQVMRVLTEKSQMQHKREDASPSNQSVPSVKREESTNADSPNAASAAARAWMSLGAAGFKQQAENCSTRKDQISADSLYNPTREVHAHAQFPRVRAEFPPNGMQFRPEKTGFPIPALVQQQVQMGNGQFQNRPMIFPQFAPADLSRFQVPHPWRGLSPRAQPSPKQDTFPPDLNIGFQSPGSPGRQSSGVMVDSQQPDLALQL